MRIVKKAFIKDGFSIQVEDWSEEYPNFPAVLAAYPKEGWRSRFRASVDFGTLDEASAAFEKLCNGGATVFDLDFTVMQRARRVPIDQVLKREE